MGGDSSWHAGNQFYGSIIWFYLKACYTSSCFNCFRQPTETNLGQPRACSLSEQWEDPSYPSIKDEGSKQQSMICASSHFILAPSFVALYPKCLSMAWKASEACSDESISGPLGTFKCDRRKRLSYQAMLNPLATPNDYWTKHWCWSACFI